jgi:hypothetical protein
MLLWLLHEQRLSYAIPLRQVGKTLITGICTPNGRLISFI